MAILVEAGNGSRLACRGVKPAFELREVIFLLDGKDKFIRIAA